MKIKDYVDDFNIYTKIHRVTGTKYDPEGYNFYGYNKDGYNRQGFTEDSYGEIHKDTGTKYDPEGYDGKRI